MANEQTGFRFLAGIITVNGELVRLQDVLNKKHFPWIMAITGSQSSRMVLADKIGERLGFPEGIQIEEALFDGGVYGGLKFSESHLGQTHVLPLHSITSSAIEYVARAMGVWTETVSDRRRNKSREAYLHILDNIPRLVDVIEKNKTPGLSSIKTVVFQTDSVLPSGEELIPGLGRFRVALISPTMPMVKGAQGWRDLGFKPLST